MVYRLFYFIDIAFLKAPVVNGSSIILLKA